MRTINITVTLNTYLQDMWYAIEGLLSTAKGTVFNEPDYGSDLYKLEFSASTIDNLNKGTMYIKDAINSYITNISSLRIVASISNNEYTYLITFNVLDTKVQGTYTKKIN